MGLLDPPALTRAQGDARYGRRRMFAVTPDDLAQFPDPATAINNAITAAAAASPKAQVVLHPMQAALTAAINPVSGVDLLGSGYGKTVLAPQAGKSAVELIGTSTSLLTNCVFADFEIDGSAQTGASGVSTSRKGVYIVYGQRLRFEHLWIHHTGGSGLGSDFLLDTLIDDIIAESCGRLNDGTAGGGAGIGIGTGQWSYEPTTVRGCITRSNKRAGLFYETQSGLLVGGVQIIGHYSEGNGDHGIADAGCSGMKIVGGVTRTNGKAGFATYAGTVGGSTPGTNLTVAGLDAINNGLDGFLFDNTVANSAGNLTVIGATSRNNQRNGIHVQTGSSNLAHVSIRDCDVRSNAYSGLLVDSSASGSLLDAMIANNKFMDNGTSSGATGREGIKVTTALVRPTIRGNRIGATAATPTQQNGIVLAATITDYWIDGNDTTGNVVAATDYSAATFSGINKAPAAGGGIGDHGCKLTRTTTQSIPTGAFTAVQWPNEAWDTDNYHDTSTNTDRITIPSGQAGKYTFVARVPFASFGTGDTTRRIVRILKNGATVLDADDRAPVSTSAAGPTGVLVTCEDVAAANDYYQVQAYQDTAGALNVDPSSRPLTFTARRLT